jgi:uncharacterized protein YggE
MKTVVRSLAILAFAFCCITFIQTVTFAQRTLAVVGEGTATHAPETMSLSLNVTTQDVTAATVFAKHNVGLDRLKQALIDAGVSASDIQEGMLAMNPTYDYSQPGQPPHLVGYHLMTPIEVKVSEMRALPKLLDVATQAGASNVSIGSFGLKNEDALRDAATKDALKDAKDRAEELAKQIGAQLGEIIAVSDMEAEAPGHAAMEREGQMNNRSLRQKVELKVVYSLK